MQKQLCKGEHLAVARVTLSAKRSIDLATLKKSRCHSRLPGRCGRICRNDTENPLATCREWMLRQLHNMEWRIGCSGYHYPEWKGLFYPPDIAQRKWFEYYCENFNTVELNVTYYKFPRVDSLKKWYARSPAGFSFAVKAPRHITHFKKFTDAQRMLRDFNDAVKQGLSEKLACILFQFPSNFKYEPDRLSRIVDILDGSVRNVVEFRHESWWNQAVYKTLRKSEIIFAGMSHPQLPEDVIATTDTLYYRFHGVPHLYNSGYETKKLEQTVLQMLSQRGTQQVFAYFNNTAEGHAVVNARQLQGICELVH